MKPQYQEKITDATTKHAAVDGRYVKQVVITCTTAGQTVKIQEPSSGMTLIAAFSPTVSTTGQPIVIPFEQPVYMNGIDVVTTATGTSNVWICFAPDQPT